MLRDTQYLTSYVALPPMLRALAAPGGILIDHERRYIEHSSR